MKLCCSMFDVHHALSERLRRCAAGLPFWSSFHEGYCQGECAGGILGSACVQKDQCSHDQPLDRHFPHHDCFLRGETPLKNAAYS